MVRLSCIDLSASLELPKRTPGSAQCTVCSRDGGGMPTAGLYELPHICLNLCPFAGYGAHEVEIASDFLLPSAISEHE
mgnify:CR=1 FL=1